ncbi:unnamed protein product, partial [Allacma fusca]
MLAVCDANYNFTYANVGAVGSESDGGIFRRSKFGEKMMTNNLPLPAASLLPNSNISAPYVFVGDEAFPLLPNLLRPYPGDNLTLPQRVFNYRLSRARRIIENSFGILIARWRLLLNTVYLTDENAKWAILCCVCLHNWIRSKQQLRIMYLPPGFVDSEDPASHAILPGSWRRVANHHN